jgi:hypothetical protein
MSRVEEIEAAIDDLPPEEYRRVVEWFRVREQRRWDEQMDADSFAGRLDFLFDEASCLTAFEITSIVKLSGRIQREDRSSTTPGSHRI